MSVNFYSFAAAGILAVGALRYYNAVVKVQNPNPDPNQRNLIEGDNIRLQKLGARSIGQETVALRKDEVVSTQQLNGQFGIPKWVIKMRNGAKYVAYGPNAIQYATDERA